MLGRLETAHEEPTTAMRQKSLHDVAEADLGSRPDERGDFRFENAFDTRAVAVAVAGDTTEALATGKTGQGNAVRDVAAAPRALQTSSGPSRFRPGTSGLSYSPDIAVPRLHIVDIRRAVCRT